MSFEFLPVGYCESVWISPGFYILEVWGAQGGTQNISSSSGKKQQSASIETPLDSNKQEDLFSTSQTPTPSPSPKPKTRTFISSTKPIV